MGVHLNDGYGQTDDGLMVGTVGLMQTLEFLYYVKKYRYAGVIYFDTFPVREEAVAECETNIKLLRRFLSLIDKVDMDTIDAIISKNDAIATRDFVEVFGLMCRKNPKEEDHEKIYRSVCRCGNRFVRSIALRLTRTMKTECCSTRCRTIWSCAHNHESLKLGAVAKAFENEYWRTLREGYWAIQDKLRPWV